MTTAFDRIIGQVGASLIELLVQMVVVLLVAPTVFCCLVGGAVSAVAVTLPWIVIGVVALAAIGAIAAVVATADRDHREVGGVGADEPVLPVRRPPALPAPRERER